MPEASVDEAHSWGLWLTPFRLRAVRQSLKTGGDETLCVQNSYE